MAIFVGISTLASEPVRKVGAKHERRMQVQMVYDGVGGTTSVALSDFTTGAKINQFGIGNVQRVEITDVMSSGATNLPVQRDAWIDVSGGMPGTIYLSGTLGAGVTTTMIVNVIGHG